MVGLAESVIGETLLRTYAVGRGQANGKARDEDPILRHRMERGQGTKGMRLDIVHHAMIG